MIIAEGWAFDLKASTWYFEELFVRRNPGATAYIYNHPRPYADQLAELDYGTVVKHNGVVLVSEKENWFQVTYGGKSGWMSGSDVMDLAEWNEG